MLIKLKALFTLVLTLVVISFLCSCQRVSYNNCATFPIGGKKVAEELKNTSYNGYEDFWEWVARLNKLKQELDTCR